jgi:hypothetical protein
VTAAEQWSPDEARRQAHEILDEPRFEGAEVPRPFAGALEWLGDRLQPIADWLGELGT